MPKTIDITVTVDESRDHIRRLADSPVGGDGVSLALKTALSDFDSTAEADLGAPWTLSPTHTVITQKGAEAVLEWRVMDPSHRDAEARSKRMAAANDWHDATIAGLDMKTEIQEAFDDASLPIPASLQTAMNTFQTLLDAARAKE